MVGVFMAFSLISKMVTESRLPVVLYRKTKIQVQRNVNQRNDSINDIITEFIRQAWNVSKIGSSV